MGHGHGLFQGDGVVVIEVLAQVEDRRRACAVADGRPHGLYGRTVRVVQLDKLCAGQPDGLVVGDPVRFLNDHFVTHPGRVRKLADPLRVGPGHAGRRGDDQAARGTGGDVSRFHAEHSGDLLPGFLMQFVQDTELPGSHAHGLHDFRVQKGAPVTRSRADGVYDRTHADVFIDTHGF